MIKLKLEVPVYDQTLYVYIVDSIKDTYNKSKTIRKLVKRENIDYDGKVELDGLVLEEERFAILFTVSKLNDDCISHELFHITRSILRNVSRTSTLSEKTEEQWAYLNGWLNGELRKLLRKKGIPY